MRGTQSAGISWGHLTAGQPMGGSLQDRFISMGHSVWPRGLRPQCTGQGSSSQRNNSEGGCRAQSPWNSFPSAFRISFQLPLLQIIAATTPVSGTASWDVSLHAGWRARSLFQRGQCQHWEEWNRPLTESRARMRKTSANQT